MKRLDSTVVFFCTPERGHFQALRGVISCAAGHGLIPYVFTHISFRDEVVRFGGHFIDLFGPFPLDEADPESRPFPCRFVSHAGHFAEEVIAAVRRLNPSLIIYETFAVIGPVVALALDVPYVNVCVNHNPNPARCIPALECDERVHISDQCGNAVTKLRDRFGLPNASPFSYVSALSPLLNIYCEPEEFLGAEDRAAFEPLEFFGCLSDLPTGAHPQPKYSVFDESGLGTCRLYVSFGTVVWRYYSEESLRALRAISQACAQLGKLQVLISLGSPAVEREAFESLANANVRVCEFVNQHKSLQQSDLFVTHHGLNSTHEAIFHRVPMLSYPFFSDQPALARKCQALGVALPLCEAPRSPLDAADIKSAIEAFRNRKTDLQASLARARSWELRTMENRDSVMQRVEAMIRPMRTPRLLQSG